MERPSHDTGTYLYQNTHTFSGEEAPRASIVTDLTRTRARRYDRAGRAADARSADRPAPDRRSVSGVVGRWSVANAADDAEWASGVCGGLWGAIVCEKMTVMVASVRRGTLAGLCGCVRRGWEVVVVVRVV